MFFSCFTSCFTRFTWKDGIAHINVQYTSFSVFKKADFRTFHISRAFLLTVCSYTLTQIQLKQNFKVKDKKS